MSRTPAAPCSSKDPTRYKPINGQYCRSSINLMSRKKSPRIQFSLFKLLKYYRNLPMSFENTIFRWKQNPKFGTIAQLEIKSSYKNGCSLFWCGFFPETSLVLWNEVHPFFCFWILFPAGQSPQKLDFVSIILGVYEG